MNRPVEMFGEAERTFFEGDSISVSAFERAHPLGPEAKSKEERAEDRAKASKIFDRLRRHPLAKPLFLTLALLMGGEMVSGMAKPKDETKDESAEQMALNDPGIRHEFNRLVFSELRKSGKTFSEVEGRFGREQWSQAERLEYGDIPTLEGKFEYLHKDNRDIINAYRDPQGRIENFGTLFVMMSDEFRHSRLAFDFVEQTRNDASKVFSGLEPSVALKLYHAYEKDLMTFGGLRHVRALAGQLKEALPSRHPILTHIEQRQWAALEVNTWFQANKNNLMLFNQQAGRVEVYHQTNGQVILLDAFPGNGGPANGATWERGMPAHMAVRTPDGEFTFDRSFEKKSASWRDSWVTDTAPLRWAQEQKAVEYQDTDGRWRLLTGEEAEFVVNGAVQKPFKDREKSTLYQWASQREENGHWKRPIPFSVQDAIDSDGQLRAIWDKNDFGPKSIQMKDHEGRQMSIFFHSSPTDEAPNEFLDFSHGCVHVKPLDLEAMASYLAKGSRIRISAFETFKKMTQKEKPGSEIPG